MSVITSTPQGSRLCSTPLADRDAAQVLQTLPPSVRDLIHAAARLNDDGRFLPYYQLYDLAPAFNLALGSFERDHPLRSPLAMLVAYSVAEALWSIPILTVRFWRVLSQNLHIVDAAAAILNPQFAAVHQRLTEDLLLYTLADDPDTDHRMLNSVFRSEDPEVPFPRAYLAPARTALVTKIGTGDVSTETTGLRAKQLTTILDALTDRPPRQSRAISTLREDRI